MYIHDFSFSVFPEVASLYIADVPISDPALWAEVGSAICQRVPSSRRHLVDRSRHVILFGAHRLETKSLFGPKLKFLISWVDWVIMKNPELEIWNDIWLVVTGTFFIFPDIWKFIIPFDELIFFRGLAKNHQQTSVSSLKQLEFRLRRVDGTWDSSGTAISCATKKNLLWLSQRW